MVLALTLQCTCRLQIHNLLRNRTSVGVTNRFVCPFFSTLLELSGPYISSPTTFSEVERNAIVEVQQTNLCTNFSHSSRICALYYFYTAYILPICDYLLTQDTALCRYNKPTWEQIGLTKYTLEQETLLETQVYNTRLQTTTLNWHAVQLGVRG